MTKPLSRALAISCVLFGCSVITSCGGGGGGGGGGAPAAGSNPPAAGLDAGFGGGTGKVQFTVDQSESHALLEDNMGRLVIVGSVTSAAGDEDMAVWRFLEDGSFDLTFSGDGLFTQGQAAGGTGADRAIAAVFDSMNRLVVVGWSTNAQNNRDLVVWRLLPDGSLDPNFNATGFVVYDNTAAGTRDDLGNAVAVDSQGRVVVAGVTTDPVMGTPGEMAVWRFTANGPIDATFGMGGVFLSGDATDQGNAVLLDTTDKILVVGGRGANLGMWLVDATGVLDPGFGNAGVQTYTDAGATLLGTAVHGYDMSTLVIAGLRRPIGGAAELLLVRIFGNGQLDTTLNGQGSVTYVANGGETRANSIDVLGTGQIVIGGMTTLQATDTTPAAAVAAIWLYTSGGVLDINLQGRGVAFLADLNTDASSNASALLLDSVSRLVVTGSASPTGTTTPQAVVWRVP